MKKSEVDPAALLIAIIPVATSPLTQSGPWDKLNTIVGLVVLVVLWAFTIGSHRRDSLESFAECAAISLVMGLILAISIAWPIQYIWAKVGGRTNNRPNFVAADDSTSTGLLVGLAVAIALTIFLWQRYARANKRAVADTKRLVPPLYKKRIEPAYNSAQTNKSVGSSAATIGQSRLLEESDRGLGPEPNEK